MAVPRGVAGHDDIRRAETLCQAQVGCLAYQRAIDRLEEYPAEILGADPQTVCRS